jgi:hypothetical protein
VGIEADLKAILQLDREHDEFSNVELEHIPAKKEEIWSAMGAASRLLVELLGFEGICYSIECRHLVHILLGLLKSNILLNMKDWVVVCLLELGLVGMASNDSHMNFPIKSQNSFT